MRMDGLIQIECEFAAFILMHFLICICVDRLKLRYVAMYVCIRNEKFSHYIMSCKSLYIYINIYIYIYIYKYIYIYWS